MMNIKTALIYVIFGVSYMAIGVVLELYITKQPPFFAFYGFLMGCVLCIIENKSTAQGEE
jgi:hypothetical protein